MPSNRTFVGDALRVFAAAVPEEANRARAFAQKRIEDELERAITLENLRLRQNEGIRSQERIDLRTEIFETDQEEKKRKLGLPPVPLTFNQEKDRALAKEFLADDDFRERVLDKEAREAIGFEEPKEVGISASTGVGNVVKGLSSGNKRFQEELRANKKAAGQTAIIDPKTGRQKFDLATEQLQFRQNAFVRPSAVDTSGIVGLNRTLVKPGERGRFGEALEAGGITKPSSLESFDSFMKNITGQLPDALFDEPTRKLMEKVFATDPQKLIAIINRHLKPKATANAAQ